MFGLETKEQYSFRVFGVNFNGQSEPSSVLSVYACGIPSLLQPPTFVSSSQSEITVRWVRPANNGGCEIFDYEI